MGLFESLGKTFLSRRFVNMNSTNFLIDVSQEEKRPRATVKIRKVPFINMGLMYGLKRSGGKVGVTDMDDSRDTIGSRARDLHDSCPSFAREAVMRRFLQGVKEQFPYENIPWFIPDWLGGLGIPSGSWGEPSELDLKIAKRILWNWGKKVNGMSAYANTPILLGRQEAKWKTWQLATEALPEPVYTKEKGWKTEEYAAIVGRQIINLLFDSRRSLPDLFEELTKKSGAIKAIRHNQRLWSPKLGVAGLEAEGIEFQPLYPNYRESAKREGVPAPVNIPVHVELD
jgi:hypothetical protein